MAALTLRGTTDPVQAARALEVRSHAIAEHFISEVLDQQPPEVARFMLDTSVLGELTAEACAAVTGRQDAAALLRSIDAANLFIVALDDDRTSYRYHHLVRQVLRAELHATDRPRELALQLRAAEWYEAAGDTRRAARHGEVDEAVRQGLAARSMAARAQLDDDWVTAVPLILVRAYTWLEDFEAVEREVGGPCSSPACRAGEVDATWAQALAWFDAGRIAEAGAAARAAQADARRLGFEQHPFAVDYLRTLAGAALERRDLDAAEHLTERALSIPERGRPAFEFLALLDRAGIWAARGQIRDALATVETARRVLAGTTSVLLARADEAEALLRLSLDDLRSPAELAGRLPARRRGLLLAAAHQHVPADSSHALHLAQHREEPPPVDLPEAGGVVASRGD